MTTIQLFSGGLDSLCLWELTGRPTPVYVLLGTKYAHREADSIRRLADRLPGLNPTCIGGPHLGGLEQPDGHIPHRNLLLAATAAAAFPDANTIILGALLGEASPDKSRAFLRAASRALTASERRPVRVVAPARRWTKTGLLRRFLAARPDDGADLIAATRSCYADRRRPCGNCPACFRRDVALFHAGLTDRRPRRPATATGRAALAAARTAGPARWPALSANNALAAAALLGLRRPGQGRR